jgi:hypothetical protein
MLFCCLILTNKLQLDYHHRYTLSQYPCLSFHSHIFHLSISL